MSVSAYKRVQRDTESPRAIERQIFSRITSALAAAGAAFDRAESRLERQSALAGSLQPALMENIRLWSVLKSDLQRPENRLPAELRAQIISIALVVERQTAAILRGEGKVATLVALNSPFIDGLAGIAPETIEA